MTLFMQRLQMSFATVYVFNVSTARRSYAIAVLAVVILSVRPSASHTRAL